jgi:hypothetical protein
MENLFSKIFKVWEVIKAAEEEEEQIMKDAEKKATDFLNNRDDDVIHTPDRLVTIPKKDDDFVYGICSSKASIVRAFSIIRLFQTHFEAYDRKFVICHVDELSRFRSDWSHFDSKFIDINQNLKIVFFCCSFGKYIFLYYDFVEISILLPSF